MTVKELKELIKDLPEDAPILVKTDNYFGYYSEANTVEYKEVKSEHETIRNPNWGFDHIKIKGLVVDSY